MDKNEKERRKKMDEASFDYLQKMIALHVLPIAFLSFKRNEEDEIGEGAYALPDDMNLAEVAAITGEGLVSLYLNRCHLDWDKATKMVYILLEAVSCMASGGDIEMARKLQSELLTTIHEFVSREQVKRKLRKNPGSQKEDDSDFWQSYFK